MNIAASFIMGMNVGAEYPEKGVFILNLFIVSIMFLSNEALAKHFDEE